MLDLIAFELKKIVMRRTSAVAVVGVAVLMCAIMLLNVTGSKMQTMDGTVYAGLDNIAYGRANEESHAGALTAERIAADIETYRDEMCIRFITGEADIEAEYENYLATLDSLGLGELQEVYAASYARYLER